MTKEDSPPKDTTLNINTSLPNLYVDDVRICIRNDDLVTINFISDTPEGKFEQTRVITHKNRLNIFVDAMCKHTGYYPTNPIERKGVDKKKKK
jgi:hypothetical protein